MCSVDTIDVQGRPRFARIAGCGTFIIFVARLYHEEKGINRNRARLRTHPALFGRSDWHYIPPFYASMSKEKLKAG